MGSEEALGRLAPIVSLEIQPRTSSQQHRRRAPKLFAAAMQDALIHLRAEAKVRPCIHTSGSNLR